MQLVWLPARAIGDQRSLSNLLELSQHNGWRLVIATMLPVLGLGIIIQPLSIWIMHNPGPVSLTAAICLSLVYSLITIGLLSCAYRALLALQDYLQAG